MKESGDDVVGEEYYPRSEEGNDADGDHYRSDLLCLSVSRPSTREGRGPGDVAELDLWPSKVTRRGVNVLQ